MIYLDGNATTQCDPRVVEAMLPYFTEYFGNPSSEIHEAGLIARRAVEKARSSILNFIGAKQDEILFTSGATESNNLVILGLARAMNRSIKNRIVTSSIEHKSVLEPCKYLKKNGYDVIFVDVDKEGRVVEKEIEKLINKKTFLVSVQLANNEIGTIQNVKAISKLAKKYGAYVHCDAAQAPGKIKINVDELGIDFLSMSAHKMYGPKGIGALYIRDGILNFPCEPILYGGGQEWGLRPGTLNVPGIIGFGEACNIASNEMDEEILKLKKLRDDFENKIFDSINGIIINGDKENRLPGTTNITFPSVESDLIISNAYDLMISSGSACTTGLHEPSHVLKAIGLSDEKVYSTIRFTFGRFNKEQDVEASVKIISNIYKNLIK